MEEKSSSLGKDRNFNLDTYNIKDLRKMANEMGLKSRRSKSEMIRDISEAFQEYEEYKREKIDKYKRKHQLGHRGKEGTTYLVVDNKGREYAMKTFRKAKSSDTLRKEYKFLRRASKAGVSPRAYDYDTVSKYIVMERMDGHLLDVMKKQKRVLLKYQQLRILDIFRKLDEAKIFHGDANLANYMLKGKEIYLIDFGFAKEINSRLVKKLGTATPNIKYMLIGFILKLKELDCPETSYKYMISQVCKEDRVKFNL